MIRAGDSLPDTRDPLELVSIVRDELKLVSKVSGYSFRNLVSRTVQLMELLEPISKWNKAAENDLKRRMEQLELKIPFRRLRANMAFRAMACVIGELLDAGVIEPEFVEFLNKSLVLHDILISGVGPQRMLSFIEPMSYPDQWEHRKDWLGDASPSLGMMQLRTPEGMIVIGQCSEFERLEWELPTETRTAVICHPDMVGKPGEHICYPGSLFPSHHTWHAYDYPSLGGLEKAYSLVIHGQERGVEMGRSEWLALNPRIAAIMGWELSQEGLFRWVNESGQIMAESLWWQDGPFGRPPPRFDDSCGWGWLVVMKPDILDEVIGKVGHAVLAKLACRKNRRSEDEGEKQPNIMVQTMTLEEAGLICNTSG